jgi:hypothetical protein
MIKVLVLFFLAANVEAYVPTVESLFRHGSNPDVSANGVSLTLVVKKMAAGEKVSGTTQDAVLLKEQRTEDFYKIFFTKSGDALKVAQTRYSSANFSENSLLHKTYYPNFSAYTFKPGTEAIEKGVFFSLLQSIIFNNGSHMVSYLKSQGVPVKLNNEIINREKVEFLADYKRYLVVISKDRNARKTEVNPLQPEDPVARERSQAIMGESMYSDTKQVSLTKDEGQIAWMVNAGPFEAAVSYKERDVQRVRFKSEAGDFEVICKDYWLANGTHAFPRYILIKTLNGEKYQVEVTNLRHYVENEEDLIRRLRNWDQILKGKESTEPRPEFLL